MIKLHKNVHSPLKYAGGKRRLLEQYQPLFPESFNVYYEPFFGGGAVYWALEPKEAHLGDANADLMSFFSQIIFNLDEVEREFNDINIDKSTFYKIRVVNGDALTECGEDAFRAARFLYLNKTGFNGLWRVNSKGVFNVPFGFDTSKLVGAHGQRIWHEKLFNKTNLEKCAKLLQTAHLHVGDYKQTLLTARKDDFVYLDPPYLPRTNTTDFTTYTLDNFRLEDHVKVSEEFKRLDNLGCKVMLSSSFTPDVIDNLYAGYSIINVTVTRVISGKVSGRIPTQELVIRNYV